MSVSKNVALGTGQSPRAGASCTRVSCGARWGSGRWKKKVSFSHCQCTPSRAPSRGARATAPKPRKTATSGGPVVRLPARPGAKAGICQLQLALVRAARQRKPVPQGKAEAPPGPLPGAGAPASSSHRAFSSSSSSTARAPRARPPAPSRSCQRPVPTPTPASSSALAGPVGSSRPWWTSLNCPFACWRGATARSCATRPW
mmetsp:Transcript_97058/g.302663  ORF Transcript_97058/g.302663 Transcript_97058/m.302663 type:complete len:201 (-) Transcript_97058:1090-1692(-)